MGVASFARYAISTYNGTASKVFMTGTSSGAMMINVLAGCCKMLFIAGELSLIALQVPTRISSLLEQLSLVYRTDVLRDHLTGTHHALRDS